MSRPLWARRSDGGARTHVRARGDARSVNVGMPRDVDWQGRTVHTGIWKHAVEGPCRVGRLNVDGDGQGDLAGHGGEQRAVYVYQLDSYRHWREQLGRDDFVFGQFGENFTVDGLGDDEVCIGDRYRIGTALFEVTQPRVTCYRLGIRMNEPRMPALLVGHGRPGFYLRVLEEGAVQAGDDVVRVATGPERMTVETVSSLLYLDGHHDPEQLRRALRIPALSPGWQGSFRALLDDQAQRGAGRRQCRAHRHRATARVVGLPPLARRRQALGDHQRRSHWSSTPTTACRSHPRSRASSSPSGSNPEAALRRSCAATPCPDQRTVPATGSASRSSPTGRPVAMCATRSRSGTASTSQHRGAASRSTTARRPVALGERGRGCDPGAGDVARAERRTGDAGGLVAPWRPQRRRACLRARRPVRCSRRCRRRAVACGTAGPIRATGSGSTTTRWVTSPPTRSPRPACRPIASSTSAVRPRSWTRYAPASTRSACRRRGCTPRHSAPRARSPPASSPGPHDRRTHRTARTGTGPLVSFVRTGLNVRWDDAFTSILELAEACDVPVRWSCRTGVCHTCETGLLDGTVAYDPEPLEPPGAGNVLVCCSRPGSNLAVDL